MRISLKKGRKQRSIKMTEEFDLKLYNWFKQLQTIAEEMQGCVTEFNDTINLSGLPNQIERIARVMNEDIDMQQVVESEIMRYSDEIAKFKLRLDKLEKKGDIVD